MLDSHKKLHRSCLINGKRVEFDAYTSSKNEHLKTSKMSNKRYEFIGVTRQIWTNDYKWNEESHDCYVFRLIKKNK